MEALPVIVWILLTVLPLSNAITCSEIVQCEYDSLMFANAQEKGDVATQCSLLGKSVECMEAAMDDCQRNSNFPEKKLNEVQQVLEMHKQQVMAYCPRHDQASAKPAGSQLTSVTSPQRVHGPPDIPKSPMCTDIMTCMFDLVQFKKALKDNRLTEACSLINPSVKCLRLAIKDCKDNRFIDNEDIANATHSLTDAEKLLESYCGYTRDQENVKSGTNLEAADKKQTVGQTGNKTKLGTGHQEQLEDSRAKKNGDGSYQMLNENHNNGNTNNVNRQNHGHNGAFILTMSRRFLLSCIFLKYYIFTFSVLS